ncbi:MAG: hypothetical protein HUU37_06585 [Bdellovibrionales bacterium]|nr:hypothetical protein [Bdellovibrionales bacterium]
MSYSEDVALSHRQLLEADLAWLQSQHEIEPTAELKRVLPLNQKEDLLAWLRERVKVILGPAWNLSDGWNLLEESVSYPKILETSGQGGQTNVLALNVGTALYRYGKKRGILTGVQFQGGTLAVRSPRAGLVQLTEKFFAPHAPADAAASRAYRLSVLFHEGRHGDGRGPSLGFSHEVCPMESDYRLLPVCDASRNGPYSVDAALSLTLAKSCQECSASGRDFLRLMAADSLSRVISFLKREEYACNEITCRVTIIEAKDTTDWDTTPEFLP